MSRLIDADALMQELEREVELADDWKTAHEIANCVKYAPTVSGWISVKDRLPVETHSMFYRFYRTQKWSKAMWRDQSDKVLVTVAFKDGTRIVTTGETHDGVWNTTISRALEPVVTHWQTMPEPPKEGDE